MTETIRRAAMQAIAERFRLPVYGQEAPQGGRKPCFTVELGEMTQKRLLGRRCSRSVTIAVRYFCGDEKQRAAEALTAADGLYEALLLIGTEEKFAAAGMRHEKTEDGIRFFATYEYHILLDAEDTKMARLEYNERKVIGYEKEGDIQQKTADGE